MKKTVLTWEHTFDDGAKANIRYMRGRFFGRDRLYVDDQEIRLPGMMYVIFSGGIDIPFSTGGRSLRFVSNDRLIGIAENGVFGKTGIEYVPQSKTVFLSYLFAVICLLIPVFTLGGSVPSIIGFLGMGACIVLYKTDKLTQKLKIILPAVTSALCWLLAVILFFGGVFTFRLFTGPEDKVFSTEGFSITLTEDFEVEKSPYYTLYAVSENVSFSFCKDDYTGFSDCPETAEEYAQYLADWWGIFPKITAEGKTGAVMEYIHTQNEDDIYFYCKVIKYKEMFFICEFCCDAADKDKYKPLFEKWLETTVISSDIKKQEV